MRVPFRRLICCLLAGVITASPVLAEQPPGLVRGQSLRDLPSPALARTVMLPVTKQPPMATDVLGYTAGQSLWAEDNGQLWALDSINGGRATWVPYTSPGSSTCSLTTAGALCVGTRRLVGTYTGHLFDVLRMSDRSTLSIDALPDGRPDLARLTAFLTPTQGIGYVSKVYDQYGSGNDAAHFRIRLAPLPG